MPLDEYASKRDFTKTREPSGRSEGKSSTQRRAPLFVVQEHHASHLHYDFRLESGGVLKSWAVPKEPTLDPSLKRLAVQVEDHPLGYAAFEGTIPEGQYGAGTVSIWDHGTYDPISESDGRLEFALHGDKLRGKFALIRMKPRGREKKPQWLLIKMKDEFARPGDTDAAEAPKPKARPKAAAKRKAGADGGGVVITHPDKIMFPEGGLTKKDVADYYERVADRLLPFLKDRPVTLERLPDGLTGEGAPHFWQKDTPASYPEWVERVELTTERGKPVRYALVNDRRALMYLVNQGTVTFHVWGSRVSDLDRPDVVLFDIDPGEAGFAAAVATAKEVRDALKAAGVTSYLKTSGKSGLHVLTAWAGDGGYDEARTWALGVATGVAEEFPELATVEIRKAKRLGRVYVDVMQNARGHHAVPPYVIRAVPAASVSTPLHWRELTADLDPYSFTPRAVLRRLARQSRDPMAPLLAADRV